MHYPTMLVHNWGNNLVWDNFRVAKPQHESHQLGCIFEIKEGSTTLGFAKIVAVGTIAFEQMTDNISYSIVNKGAAYLLAILTKMYKLQQGDKIQVLTLQWTERDLECHRVILETHWQHIIATTAHASSSSFQTINLPA